MKQLLFFLLLFACSAARAQLTVTVDSYSGDTTISTGFDTLSTQQSGDKSIVNAKVVGVKTISKKKTTYWLFFYFLPSESHSIRIGGSNYAYFKTINNQYFRIPYKGKPQSYSGKEDAGFFVDVTAYTGSLMNTELTDVRLETSDLYEQITLTPPYRKKIAHVVSMLTSR